MPLSSDTTSQLGIIKFELPDAGLTLDRFHSYTFNQDFLTPSDGWHFVVGDDSITQDVRNAVHPGAKVNIKIDGHAQSTGTIRVVEVGNDRSGGTQLSVEGFDIFGPMITGHVDQGLQFTEGQTLFDVISKVFSDYGITTLADDNETNRNILTGQSRGISGKLKAKGIQKFKIHQLQPYPNEGAFAFVSRISQRFGLWSWPSADGTFAIVGKPSFDQPPSYTLRRHLGPDSARNNILEGGMREDGTDQPSIILASGSGGGQVFAKATLRSAMINPAVNVPLAALNAVEARYPSVKFVQMPALPAFQPFLVDEFIPLYLHDEESHTQEQLDNFVQREMSLRVRRSRTAHYTIEGHTIDGVPVALDTIVNVDDDRAGLHGPMWVLSRTFTKTAGTGSGTRTKVELIWPGSLVF